MMPRPSRSVFMKSCRFSAGSPKNLSAPWFSSMRSWRCTEADRGLGDVAVLRADGVGVLDDEIEQRAQVLEVEHRQVGVVGDPEGDVEHALLHVVELEKAGEQQRPHLADGGADRMALLAEQVPERHGKAVRRVFDADLLRPLDEGRLAVARLRRRPRGRP